MSYTDVLKKEWKSEVKINTLGFLTAIFVSIYFFITQTDSVLIYFLLWIYPALISIHPARLPKATVQTYWSKYPGHSLNFYRGKVSLRFVQLVLHMLLLICLNQIYNAFFDSNFTSNFWNHQFYIVFVLLYLYLMCLGQSMKETIVPRKNFVKSIVLILSIFGVTILAAFFSWVFDFIYYLVNSTYIEFKLMRPLVFMMFSIIQYNVNKKFIRQLP
ncbi:hypothetical protein [Paraliobacillus zengyii]|uniref:hypothetical protein n=1 Tax=Paraliobacillus zengyii TaxID=2213194 RepID=UPI000DD442D6|nr:hypothetical protein [Paraliobacillus zengyii]